jgi:hypothetical protein
LRRRSHAPRPLDPRTRSSFVPVQWHVLQAVLRDDLLVLIRVKYLAAFFALDVLDIIFACYHANLGMLADWLHDLWGFGLVCRRDCGCRVRPVYAEIVPAGCEESMHQTRAGASQRFLYTEMRPSWTRYGLRLLHAADSDEEI